MADTHRRSTMQPTADPYGNARSGIPVPSTIKKPPPTNMRMSLSGPALRAPYQQPPATNPRHSMMRSQNVNPLLQSTTKNGRTPLNSSTRRGSVWGGGAVTAPSSSQSIKDTRPLRDRPYQMKMRQEIHSWLQCTGYDISMQTLANITGKDFRAIFHHLVIILDPWHPFAPTSRFEDEFLPALKALKYPFVTQIDNKWLAAPASMHSWPFLLGMLHWLTEMGKARVQYLQSEDTTLQVHTAVPEEFDDPHHHLALAFEYYTEAYGTFLRGSDDFEESEQVLEARYAKKNETILADLEKQKAILSQVKAEHEKAKLSGAPIEKLKKDNGFLKRDREKFHDVMQRFEARKKNLIDTIAMEKAELAVRGQNLEQLEAEQTKLEQVVKTQNLSAEEVIRMNTDHETLSRNLEDLKHKISETHKSVMSLEVTVTNRAAAAEEALDMYNHLLSSLGLFPPLPPPFQDIDLTLELNTAVSNPQQLLSGADIRKVIKPTLSGIAESKRGERATVESERIRVDNDLDRLTLDCENVEEEIGETEKKIGGLNEQADDLRDAAQQEGMVSSQEAARLERDLAVARTNALANGMGIKTRFQALQFDYREQVEKVTRLREETVRAIIKNSHDIVMFKEEVSQQLKHVREFAEEN